MLNNLTNEMTNTFLMNLYYTYFTLLLFSYRWSLPKIIEYVAELHNSLRNKKIEMFKIKASKPN